LIFYARRTKGFCNSDNRETKEALRAQARRGPARVAGGTPMKNIKRPTTEEGLLDMIKDARREGLITTKSANPIILKGDLEIPIFI